MLTEAEAARAVLGICGVGLALSAARDLLAGHEFIGNGVLSWPVIGADRPRRLRAFTWLMPWRRYRLVLIAQCAGGIAAPAAAAAQGRAAAAIACLLAVTSIMTLQRTGYGLDGADQMFALDTVAAAGALTVGGPTGRLLLLFLTAQLVLSYLIAGVAKLVSPVWRDGSCLGEILSTDTYGSPRLAMVLRTWPLAGAALAWGVMLFEVTFVGAFIPGVPMWSFLAAGIALHLGIAVTMGLTTFLFAFVAAYPAAIYTAATLTG